MVKRLWFEKGFINRKRTRGSDSLNFGRSCLFLRETEKSCPSAPAGLQVPGSLVVRGTSGDGSRRSHLVRPLHQPGLRFVPIDCARISGVGF
jgi:hypothetical protein